MKKDELPAVLAVPLAVLWRVWQAITTPVKKG